MSRLLLLITLTAACLSVGKAKTDRNLPHPHKGVLKAYTPGPFGVKLSRHEETVLAEGKPVMKQTVPTGKADESGSAICIQDVRAPAQCVWKQILDLDNYKGKVPKLNYCKNYFTSKARDGTLTIKTKMIVGVMPGYAVSAMPCIVLC
jgi:hypothetical protein